MGKVILIVDDDIDDAELLCEALEEIAEDIHCVYAYNANYGWDYLKNTEQKPAYIFLDLHLPPGSGKPFLQQLKKNALLNNIPVIVWSTSAMENEIEEIYDLGAHCYISKPKSFDDPVLVNTIGRCIKKI